MRLLTNENIPFSVVRHLRLNGHDVLSASESMPGAVDVEVLERAQSEQRVLVTQDKDFGELAFRGRLSAHCGVILFRLTGDDPDDDIRRMVDSVESRESWSGLFAVVDPYRIRVRDMQRP